MLRSCRTSVCFQLGLGESNVYLGPLHWIFNIHSVTISQTQLHDFPLHSDTSQSSPYSKSSENYWKSLLSSKLLALKVFCQSSLLLSSLWIKILVRPHLSNLQHHLLHHSACWLVHFFSDQREAPSSQSLLFSVFLNHQLSVQIHTHGLMHTQPSVWMSASETFILHHKSNTWAFTWSWTRKCSTSLYAWVKPCFITSSHQRCRTWKTKHIQATLLESWIQMYAYTNGISL